MTFAPPHQGSQSKAHREKRIKLDKSVQLYDYGTGHDIFVIEMRTFWRLELVRRHFVT